MSPVAITFLLVFGTAVSARYHRRAQLSFRDIVNIGPNGTCPAVPTTTVELQPVVFSSYIQYDTTFDPFGRGTTYTVTNAPTLVVIRDTITNTIVPTRTPDTPQTSVPVPGASSSLPQTPPPDTISSSISSVTPSSGANGGISVSETAANGGSATTSRAGGGVGPGVNSSGSSVVTSAASAAASAGSTNENLPSIPSSSSSSRDDDDEPGVSTTPISTATSIPDSEAPGSVTSSAAADTGVTTGPNSLSSGAASDSASFSASTLSSRSSSAASFSGTLQPADTSNTLSASSLPTTSTTRSQSLSVSSPTVLSQNTNTPTTRGSPATSTLTTTTSRSLTRTRTATGSLRLGNGLPSGFITNIPEPTQFIFLAFSTVPGAQSTSSSTADEEESGQRRAEKQRRQATASSSVSKVQVVDLSQPTFLAPDAVLPDNCDNSTPLILSNGVLQRFNDSVAKLAGAPDAVLGTLVDVPKDQIVNRTFALENGILTWNTPNDGAATFYDCGGELKVGFPNPGADNCVQIVVGAIAGSECTSQVALTSTVSPEFTAPIDPALLNETSSTSIPASSTTEASLSVIPATSAPAASASSSTDVSSTISPSSTPSTDSASNTASETIDQLSLTTATSLTTGSQSSSTSSSVVQSLLSSASSSSSPFPSSSFALSTSLSISSINTGLSTSSGGPLSSSSPSASSSTSLLSTSLSTPSLSTSPSTSSSLLLLSTSSLPTLLSPTSISTELPATTSLPTIVLATSSLTPLLPATTSLPSLRLSTSISTLQIPSTVSLTLIPSVSPLPQCISSLTPQCDDLASKIGFTLIAFQQTCRTSLNLPSLDTGVISVAEACFNEDVDQNTSGAPITACLRNAIVCAASRSTTMSVSRTSDTTSPTQTCIPYVLPAACQFLNGLSNALLAQQLPLCSAALGSAAAVAQSAGCFTITPQKDYTQCLSSALTVCPGTSPTTYTLSTTATNSVTPSASPVSCLAQLPLSCSGLVSAGASQVFAGVSLCQLELATEFGGSISSSVATCLTRADILQPSPGTPVVNCLNNVVLCEPPTVSSASSSAAVSTSTALPQCVRGLPQACLDLDDQTGLQVLAGLPVCANALDPSVAASIAAQTCLSVNVNIFTSGAAVRQCLQTSIVCGSPTTASTTPATTSATSTSRPSTSAAPGSFCLAALPATCQALSGLTNFQLVSQAGLCATSLTTSLQSTQGLSTALLCIDTDLTAFGNDMIACLNRNNVCPSSTTVSASPSGVVSSSSTASAVPIPTCLSVLPQVCARLNTFVLVNDLSNNAAACLNVIGTSDLSLATIAGASNCLNPVSIIGGLVTGQNLVDCLNTQVACSVPASSTTASTVQAVTTTSVSTASSSLPTCISALPAICNNINIPLVVGLPAMVSCRTALTREVGGDGLANSITCLGQSETSLGTSVYQCLEASALCRTSTTATSSTSISTAAPSALPTCATVLPQLCLNLATSIAVPVDAATCLTSLSISLSGSGLVAAGQCLDPLLTPARTGPFLLDCLTQSVSCTSSTSSTSPASTASTLTTTTSSSSPTVPACLSTLPQACTDLISIDGLGLITSLPTCTTALGVFALVPSAAVCLLSNTVTIATTGLERVQCLQAALQCPGTATTATSALAIASTTTTTTTATSSAPSATPTTPTCLTTLPQACTALSSVNGLALTTALANCESALLPVLSSFPSALVCLNTATVDIFTTGSSRLQCLQPILLCPAAATTTTSSSALAGTSTLSSPPPPPPTTTTSSRLSTLTTTTSRTSTTPSASPTGLTLPTCLNALPAACASLATVNGLALVTPLATCQTALTASVAGSGLTAGLACVNVSPTITSQGSSYVGCLNAGVLCR